MVKWSKEAETVIWTASCWINLSWAKFEDKVEEGEEEVKEEGGGTKGQERRGRKRGWLREEMKKKQTSDIST